MIVLYHLAKLVNLINSNTTMIVMILNQKTLTVMQLKHVLNALIQLAKPAMLILQLVLNAIMINFPTIKHVTLNSQTQPIAINLKFVQFVITLTVKLVIQTYLDVFHANQAGIYSIINALILNQIQHTVIKIKFVSSA